MLLVSGFVLVSCATQSTPASTDIANRSAPITMTEAKAEACPEALLEAGASPADCACIENNLYTLGQAPDAFTTDGQTPKAIFGGEEGTRKIAIGLLRHDAIEQCGLFDPDHIVAKNL